MVNQTTSNDLNQVVCKQQVKQNNLSHNDNILTFSLLRGFVNVILFFKNTENLKRSTTSAIIVLHKSIQKHTKDTTRYVTPVMMLASWQKHTLTQACLYLPCWVFVCVLVEMLAPSL